MTADRRATESCRYCGAAIKAKYATWWVHVAPPEWPHHAASARKAAA
jgi:hypothetical protein